jgi:hypothetical protein
MARTQGMTLLSAAAMALKSTGANVPINKQIDSVSNALTGATRQREMTAPGEGYPPEAKNVLEILKIQINKAVNSLSEQVGDEQLFNKLVEDLEVIESFADRIITFYAPKEQKVSPDDEELATTIKQSFAKAKSEAITAIALEKIFNKINNLESWYRNNPKLTSHEFREKLEELSTKVKKWEDELVPGDPMLRDSETIAERIYKLKSKLLEAIEISEMQDHPGVVGEMGLNILRLASDMVQHAKSQFEVEQAAMMALEANRNLKRGGKQFQEKGIAFNLLIQQSIAVFVNRQIRIIEKELEAPLYYIPGDVKTNEDLAKRLIIHMERLIIYFEFVDKWAGPHQEDLRERIALVYEKIVDRAEKAKYYVLDEASKLGTSKELAMELANVATKFRRAETMGKDKIDPSVIFHERLDLKDEIRKLQEQIPEPATQTVMPADKLGRIYYKLLTLRKRENLDSDLQSRISAALSRVELQAFRQNTQIDIFNEMLVRSIYLKDAIDHEIYRFMVLLDMDPAVTNPLRYSNYPNPSEFPFKGTQLTRVIRNNRIINNFIEGRFSPVKEHEAFKKVSQGFYHELELYCSKALIDLLKRLKLSLTKPPKLDEIEYNLESRIQSLPPNLQSAAKNLTVKIEDSEIYSTLPFDKQKEGKELQMLWLMLQYLKYPLRMNQIEAIEEMHKEDLIACSVDLINKAEKEFLQNNIKQLQEEMQVEVHLPFTEEYLETYGGDAFAKKLIKKFIQLKNPLMKTIEPFSELLLKNCREHKEIAERILKPIAANNPVLLRKIIVDTMEEVFLDAEKITLHLKIFEIASINQENQFYKNHQVPEVFPLYVEGLTELRTENENLHDKMLSLVENNSAFAELIESLATESMFNVTLNKIRGMLDAFTGVPEITGLELEFDDLTQFLTIDPDKKKGTLKGFGLMEFYGPMPETGTIDRIGDIIVSIEIPMQCDSADDAIVRFIEKPYNSFIAEIREGKVWNLF